MTSQKSLGQVLDLLLVVSGRGKAEGEEQTRLRQRGLKSWKGENKKVLTCTGRLVIAYFVIKVSLRL
jgi:hypothetical protein